MNQTLLRAEDLVNNPMRRVPVCLCLDTSTSMNSVAGEFSAGGASDPDDQSTGIEKLNAGIELLFDAIKEDEIARYAAEISIVTFSDDAECISDFSSIDRQEVPELVADGNTCMGEGINLALDLLEKRKQEYRENGVDYYQPWLVLMTDGEANGDAEEYQKAVERVKKAVGEKKLTVFAIGIGDYADMNALSELSPNRPPLKLKGLKFSEFFTWLSQSVSITSQSDPSETMHFDDSDMEEWCELPS